MLNFSLKSTLVFRTYYQSLVGRMGVCEWFKTKLPLIVQLCCLGHGSVCRAGKLDFILMTHCPVL